MSGLRSLARHPRLLSAVAVATVLYAGFAQWMPASRALLIAFDIGASLFLFLMLRLMARASVHTMRQRAIVQDEGKWMLLLTTVGLVSVVIAALSAELHAAKVKSLSEIALASSSILLSWFFVAIMFSEQYAHSYYMVPGQLGFPQTESPNYWDFLYFAVVVSMCSQTSDVTVLSSPMRRMVMLHSVCAFFFNIVIIGITVNVVAGVL